MLPLMISENQSGFLKGRLIIENIQLAQEIVQNIKSKNKGGNVVIKLDMAKAYDRMSWPFINVVLRKFDFSEEVTNLIIEIVSNVWYSIIINGTRNGFFSSSQGLKQGDPLSPSLFIIGAEVCYSNFYKWKYQITQNDYETNPMHQELALNGDKQD
ncbi:secreted RxLR effector protein 78-like [Lycium ferocissimum]|uniref:secreted RxLR effector protein 78-like n=1 Tax=Lycium ferocissimum TaxID=112874 RepID=UPI00281623EE|nr:secreted RxLR effector protein 78-like [Lycium ferocissimum]